MNIERVPTTGFTDDGQRPCTGCGEDVALRRVRAWPPEGGDDPEGWVHVDGERDPIDEECSRPRVVRDRKSGVDGEPDATEDGTAPAAGK